MMSQHWHYALTTNAPFAGQFFQSLYKDVSEMKGVWGFGYDRDAHATELSPLVTEHNRLKLYAEWRRYWNVVWTWIGRT